MKSNTTTGPIGWFCLYLVLILLAVAPVFADTNVRTLTALGVFDATDTDNIFDTATGSGTPSNLYWGNVLICDASRPECGIGQLDGSGTANTYPKFATASTLTNSIVADSSGNFVVSGDVSLTGDIAVNGNDITGNQLDISAAGYVRIGDAGIPGTANADDDLYVEDDLEIDGIIQVDGAGTSTFTDTVDVANFTAPGHSIGYVGSVYISDGDDNGVYFNSGDPSNSITKQSSFASGAVTGNALQFMIPESSGWLWCNENECGMSINGRLWNLNVSNDFNTQGNLVYDASEFEDVVTITGGSSGASPTPMIDFGNYYDNSGTASASHITVWSDLWGVGVSTSTTNFFSGSSISLHEGTSEVMYWENSGYTGISNSNPESVLHIGDNGGTDGSLRIESTAGRILEFEAITTTPFLHVGSGSSHDFQIVRNDVDMISFFSSSTQIGVGGGVDLQFEDGGARSCVGTCGGSSVTDGYLHSEDGIYVDGNSIFFNYDGGNSDSGVYFYEDGSATGERFYYDSGFDGYYFSETVQLSAGALRGGGSFITNSHNDVASQDGYFYFYEGGSAVGESIYWDNSLDRLYFTDDLYVFNALSKSSGSFIIPHPQDPTQQIKYHFFEGPKEGVVLHGTANLINGSATIVFPDHFEAVSTKEHIFVQVTPRDARSLGLIVTNITEYDFTVKEVQRGTGSYEFYYLVTGVRRGYEALPNYVPSNLMPGDGNVDENNTLLIYDSNSTTDKTIRRYMKENGLLDRDEKINLRKYDELGMKRPLTKKDTERLPQLGISDQMFDDITREDVVAIENKVKQGNWKDRDKENFKRAIKQRRELRRGPDIDPRVSKIPVLKDEVKSKKLKERARTIREQKNTSQKPKRPKKEKRNQGVLSIS